MSQRFASLVCELLEFSIQQVQDTIRDIPFQRWNNLQKLCFGVICLHMSMKAYISYLKGKLSMQTSIRKSWKTSSSPSYLYTIVTPSSKTWLHVTQPKIITNKSKIKLLYWPGSTSPRSSFCTGQGIHQTWMKLKISGASRTEKWQNVPSNIKDLIYWLASLVYRNNCRIEPKFSLFYAEKIKIDA